MIALGNVLTRIPPTLRPHLLIFALSIALWPLLVDQDLFERFHDFSRGHEDWEIDEIGLLVVNLTVASILSLIVQSRNLRKTLSDLGQERRRAEANARHDPLTGLMNRRALKERLGSFPAADRVVAFFDLDRFKPVNDLHGHAAGDKTLQTVAQRLNAEVGEIGQLARLGGDEFAAVFDPGIDSGRAERVARRLIRAVEHPIPFDGARIRISTSIGLANWTEGLSESAALEQADKALFLAKKQGRGQFAWYDAELDRQSKDRAAIEADLREAILTGAIQPWFQPIVRVDGGGIDGLEALARWTHPTRGEIPPTIFIEIAEDCGLIEDLGWTLLRQSCECAGRWPSWISLSFNVSPMQFRNRNLLEKVREILAESGFDPHRLTLEITESSIIHDLDTARESLDGLKELGISIALDDFGTGYSSLAGLRQLPFDRIKIDRSFITDIRSHSENQKLVLGIMALANGLDLDVTAEGVESPEDLAFLEELQCSLAQGFLFDEALPAEQIDWLLETKWTAGRPEMAGDAPEALDRVSGEG